MEKQVVAVCQCDVNDSKFFGEVAETSTEISTDVWQDQGFLFKTSSS